MIALGLILGVMAPANANHISGVAVSPESDSAPAETCNAFTATLTTGQSQTNLVGQTVDVEVRDTDTDNPDSRANESTTPVNFCTPPSGPNPRPADEEDNLTLNADGECEQGDPGVPPIIPATPPEEDPGCDGTISAEVGVTDVNGQITFGMRSDDPGHYSVLVYHDHNDNDTKDTTEPSDTSTKTFTEPVPAPQCSDGADNDGDGKIDFGTTQANDPGCIAASDNDETDPGFSPPSSQCENGYDDDLDGLIDYGSDGGCTARTDNDETGSGNRRLATAVTIRYNRPVHAFKGTVSNAHRKCRVNRSVVLMRDLKGGKDAVIKGVRADDKGNYFIKRRKVGGKRWYVKARPKQFPRQNGGTVFCQPGRSVTIKIARRTRNFGSAGGGAG